MEPLLSLAFTLNSNKGCYAILLGSGVSRSAQIPTGWEVVLDLVEKLAKLKGENCFPDPAAWFKTAFGKAPDYSDLLDQIAKSPTERSQLLRAYFEATAEDREENRKLPTAAHQAIASLVQGGYVRVIVTTNFDRLMEQALEALGISPTIIASADAAEGALPLAHSACTVVKVHGDYLDTRIKNTVPELASYDPRVEKLLDQILDEYGVIVCGWSADWDLALRAAFERCKGHRFTTYWCSRGQPGPTAKNIINLRRASVIKIAGADEFLADLAEKVAGIEQIGEPHPLSAKLGVATLKRYVADDRFRVRLHDLAQQEIEIAHSKFMAPEFLKLVTAIEPQAIDSRLQAHEALMKTPIALAAHGCFWGDEQYSELWVRCLERLAGAGSETGFTAWPDLRMYPALLFLYAGGVGAVAGKRYYTLNALLTAESRQLDGSTMPAAIAVRSKSRLEPDVIRRLPSMENRHTPLSDRLHGILRSLLKDLEPDDRRFDDVFDRFEIFLALMVGDLQAGSEPLRPNVAEARQKVALTSQMPVGRFGWRGEHRVLNALVAEQRAVGQNWPPFQTGMFHRDQNRFQALVNSLTSRINQLNWT